MAAVDPRTAVVTGLPAPLQPGLRLPMALGRPRAAGVAVGVGVDNGIAHRQDQGGPRRTQGTVRAASGPAEMTDDRAGTE